MRIASFNINGIKARLPRLKEWLEETRPTVACLQEIKTMDEGFPADEFESIGYKAIWHGQKRFNGVAILVKALRDALKALGSEETVMSDKVRALPLPPACSPSFLELQQKRHARERGSV